MSLLLVATLLAATPEADDVVVQADGTVLHGQVISCGDGTWVIASATSRSSSSARISLQRAMHSLQM